MLAAIFAAMLAVATLTHAVSTMIAARESAQLAFAERLSQEQSFMSLRKQAFVIAATQAARAARVASMGGETVHIARARAQTEVEALATTAGLVNVEVALMPKSASRPADEASSLVELINLNLEADFDAAAFARFLEALSASEYSLTPLSVDVAQDLESSRLGMTISAYALSSEFGA
jgi:hypothetical protein